MTGSITAATLVPTTAPESVEEADLRVAARAIADRYRDSGDAAACWAGLADSGFTALRDGEDGEDGEPLATATMTAIVVEELAGAVAEVPLVGALLAGELARLAGTAVDEPATVLLTEDLTALSADGTGVAWDAAAPVRRALGLAEGALVAVPLGEPRQTQDLSRPIAEPAGAAERLGGVPDLARFTSFARVVLAADLLGTASRVFADAVAYAGRRVQFGVPIGSFQAIQHLCGQAYAQLEALRSAVLTAAWALDSDSPDHAETALVAKSYAARVCIEVVETAVQVFGGVAITWEFPAHRHLRRVLLAAEVFGGAEACAAALLTLVEKETTDGPQ